jgi:hypothetical protein
LTTCATRKTAASMAAADAPTIIDGRAINLIKVLYDLSYPGLLSNLASFESLQISGYEHAAILHLF